ncbi:hypothetical protein FOXYSP1_13709 [Fusarium oxysporum f. sp. phaseoli]
MLLVGRSAFGPRMPSAEARSRHFGCAKPQRSGRWITAAEHVTRTTFVLASRERRWVRRRRPRRRKLGLRRGRESVKAHGHQT